MKKPNGLYRKVSAFEACHQWQCLSCKDFFISFDDETYKYCPHCGVEFKYEFTKKNNRNTYYVGKRRLPYISFFIYNRSTREWELKGQIYSQDFVGSREQQGHWPEFPQMFKKKINDLRKHNEGKKIKVVINRWDGSIKEFIYR